MVQQIRLSPYFFMKKILAIIPLFFTISCGSEKKEYWTFTKQIIDGDTFILENNTRIRILGIDTPESFDKDNNFERTTGIRQLYASRAKSFSTNWLFHKKIHISFSGKDKYGRSVAIVKDNNSNLCVELVKRGLAIIQYISVDPKSPFYTTKFSYYEELLKAQYEATINKRGIYENLEMMNLIFPK